MDSENSGQRLLLSIVEPGGYRDSKTLCESLGYRVFQITTTCKALALLESNQPNIIVAKFNFQSDFRDHTSSLEPLFVGIQHSQHGRVIVFWLITARLTGTYPLIPATLPFPIESNELQKVINE